MDGRWQFGDRVGSVYHEVQSSVALAIRRGNGLALGWLGRYIPLCFSACLRFRLVLRFPFVWREVFVGNTNLLCFDEIELYLSSSLGRRGWRRNCVVGGSIEDLFVYGS